MRSYIFAAGLLFYLSVSLWWLLVVQDTFNFIEFVLVNLIANSLANLVWLWLDLRARRSEGAVEYHFSFHNLTAVGLLSVLALLVLFNFFDVNEMALLNTSVLTWPAVFLIAALLTASLLDRYAKHAVAGLYALGLIAGALGLQ